MRDEQSARKLSEAVTLLTGVMERLRNPIGFDDRMELVTALAEIRQDVCAVFEVMRRGKSDEQSNP